MQAFIEIEEKNFKAFKFINELCNQIETLENQIGALKSKKKKSITVEEKVELEKNQQVKDDPKRKLFFELQEKAEILNAEIAQSEQKIKDNKALISKLIPRLEVNREF